MTGRRAPGRRRRARTEPRPAILQPLARSAPGIRRHASRARGRSGSGSFASTSRRIRRTFCGTERSSSGGSRRSSNQTQVYRPGGVDTQIVLRQLADRGRQAFRDAQHKLVTTFLIQTAIGMTATSGYTSLVSNHVAVRGVPLVGDSLGDLAVSTTGRELLDAALCDLARVGPGSQTTLRPAASGLVCEIQPPSDLVDGVLPIPRTAIAVAGAAGVVAAAFRFTFRTPSCEFPRSHSTSSAKGLSLHCSTLLSRFWIEQSCTGEASSN